MKNQYIVQQVKENDQKRVIHTSRRAQILRKPRQGQHPIRSNVGRGTDYHHQTDYPARGNRRGEITSGDHAQRKTTANRNFDTSAILHHSQDGRR